MEAPASPLPTPNSSRWAIIQFGDYARDMTGARAFTHQQRQQVADTFCATTKSSIVCCRSMRRARLRGDFPCNSIRSWLVRTPLGLSSSVTRMW